MTDISVRTKDQQITEKNPDVRGAYDKFPDFFRRRRLKIQ